LDVRTADDELLLALALTLAVALATTAACAGDIALLLLLLKLLLPPSISSCRFLGGAVPGAPAPPTALTSFFLGSNELLDGGELKTWSKG
jgi:hypothetical protein